MESRTKLGGLKSSAQLCARKNEKNCAGNKEFPSVCEKDEVMCEPPVLMGLGMLKIIK